MVVYHKPALKRSKRKVIRDTFRDSKPKIFFELGSNRLQDTPWLAAIKGVHLYAMDPDPRNPKPALPNVSFRRAAVAAKDGPCQFWLSDTFNGKRGFTSSSSIRRPTGHLTVFPTITFVDEPIVVDGITLDTFARECRVDRVDFIWADVQGAEADMIAGGREILARTRYLYTEFEAEELYEGAPNLERIIEMLPKWKIVEVFQEKDVLLRNPDADELNCGRAR